MIETFQLSKRYGNHWAIRDCTLSIGAGHNVALVGPNGAGKTTLLHLLVGLLRPTAGSVRIAGQDPRVRASAVLPRVGFVAQNHPLYPGYSIEETLELAAHLNVQWDMSFAIQRLDQLELPRKRRVDQLSGGEHAQLALTLALAKRPDLLLLDEPLASLDPLARMEFVAAIRSVSAVQKGLTVIVSSHIVIDLETFCDYLIVLSASEVLASSSIEALLGAAESRVEPSQSGGKSPDAPGTGRSALERLVVDYLRMSRERAEEGRG